MSASPPPSKRLAVRCPSVSCECSVAYGTRHSTSDCVCSPAPDAFCTMPPAIGSRVHPPQPLHRPRVDPARATSSTPPPLPSSSFPFPLPLQRAGTGTGNTIRKRAQATIRKRASAQSLAIFSGNISADLLKVLPGVLRITDGLAQLRRHIHRVHLAFGLVAEIQMWPVSVRRIVCACAGRISALAGRLRQRPLHHRSGGLFEFVQAFTLTAHYVVRSQAKSLTSSLRVSRPTAGVLTPSNQVRSYRKSPKPRLRSPENGPSFLRRKVARVPVLARRRTHQSDQLLRREAPALARQVARSEHRRRRRAALSSRRRLSTSSVRCDLSKALRVPPLAPRQIPLSGSEPATAGVHLFDTFARQVTPTAPSAHPGPLPPTRRSPNLFLSRAHSPLGLWTHEYRRGPKKFGPPTATVDVRTWRWDPACRTLQRRHRNA